MNLRSTNAFPFPDSDAERRFGGLARLYGPQALARLRAAHVAVLGLGGVGSWTAEALARCGVGKLTLVDLDHISESNVNRQVHALTPTVGQSKVQAMAARILGIYPDCVVTQVDDFVSPENVSQVLHAAYTLIVDATDQLAAKIAITLHARARGVALLLCGGAGGKTDPLALRVGDLAQATNDALLAKLRYTLRRAHGFAGALDNQGRGQKRVPKMGVRALWFDQTALLPHAWEAVDVLAKEEAGQHSRAPQGLSCAGYGSVVTITAVMGLVAANEALQQALR